MRSTRRPANGSARCRSPRPSWSDLTGPPARDQGSGGTCPTATFFVTFSCGPGSAPADATTGADPAARCASRRLFLIAEQLLVIAVVLADELEDPLLRRLDEPETAIHLPGRGKNIRVLDRQLVLDSLGHSREALHHVQILTVPIAVDLGLVVETDGVDDQRVAVPAADRVAKPGGIGISLMRLAVERDDAERVR